MRLAFLGSLNNNLIGQIPSSIGNISSLIALSLAYNHLEGKLPKEIGHLKSLEILYVGGNSLSEVGMLKNVDILDLSQNYLSGNIPETIGQCESLEYFYLQGTESLGFVYKGSLNSEEKVVAIKVPNHQKKRAQKTFIYECNALRNIRHRNLVKVFTYCSSVDYNGNEFKAPVFEYMSNGSLEEWLHPDEETIEQPRTLNLEKRIEIMMGVAFALNYLHYECEQPIVHHDLKPSNVLLDDGKVAYVSDFGLATILSAIDGNEETSTSAIKGTIGYAPPEYGMSSQVSTEGDMYSYGILLLEMLTRKIQ